MGRPERCSRARLTPSHAEPIVCECIARAVFVAHLRWLGGVDGSTSGSVASHVARHDRSGNPGTRPRRFASARPGLLRLGLSPCGFDRRRRGEWTGHRAGLRQKEDAMSTDAIVLLRDRSQTDSEAVPRVPQSGSGRGEDEAATGRSDHRGADRAHIPGERVHVSGGAQVGSPDSRTTSSSPTRSTTSRICW